MFSPKTAENLRVRYITGLSLIALLITASFITMQQVVHKQRNYSNLVSIAGNQAGLVNRIAFFGNLMAVTDDELDFQMAKSQVGRTINKIRESHQAIRYGSEELKVPAITNDNLEVLYTDPMVGLENALNRFLENAERLYATPQEELNVNHESYIALTIYGPHVLEPLLNAAVEEYQSISKEAIVRIENLEWIIWTSTLITLLFEVIFIFRPFERRIRQTLSSLEESVAKLTSTRARLLTAQKVAAIGDWRFETASGELSFSDQLYAICDIPPMQEPLTQKRVNRLIHPDDRRMVNSRIKRVILDKKPASFEHRVLTPDGREKLVIQNALPMVCPNNKVEMLQGTVQDITERQELSIRLKKQAENIPGFIFQMYLSPSGEEEFVYASQGGIDIFGLTPAEVKEGVKSIAELVHPDDKLRVRKKIMIASLKLKPWRDQFRVIHPQKKEIWVEGHATAEKLHAGGIHWYGYLWDITERKMQENQIRQLALFDPLTGLANRRLLKDRLYHATITSHRHGNYSGLLMLDLDNFKTLNDTQGHNTGDALLVEVASRITDNVRETDTVARLGGDEFVVIFEWIGEDAKEAKTTLLELSEKIRIALSQPYILGQDKHIHHASASIGATLFKGKTISDGELLKRADLAMFEAKELGRNRVCLYRKERQALISSRTAIIDELQLGLKNEEFSLAFQPQFARDGSISGAEALLRWKPAKRDPVSPAIFIPIAEESGLIISLGDWVLEAACKHLTSLASIPLPPSFAVAINISGHQLSDEHFLDKVKKTLSRYDTDLSRLKFELTESSLVQDIGRAQDILETLGTMGIHCELDDFGTGYSSLTSLKNLPLSAIKIDKSLIHGIGIDSRDEAILKASIAMTRALKLAVIAEGVETKEQDEFLFREGCDISQGYYHSRPLTFQKFVDLLWQQVPKEVAKKAENQGSGKKSPINRAGSKENFAFSGYRQGDLSHL